METVPIAEQAKAHRLIRNCFEIWGQVHLYKNEFEKSRQALNRALEIFGNGKSYDQLLIYKTQSIISALEAQSSEPCGLVSFEEVQRILSIT